MIPPFNDGGLLPPGIHPASLGEVEDRFGSKSELRRAQIESVRWMLGLAVRAGIVRIILNGSFVTSVLEPNDVDCVLLREDDYPRDSEAAAGLEGVFPFLDIAIVSRDDFNGLVNVFFATDRMRNPKGVVEVIP